MQLEHSRQARSQVWKRGGSESNKCGPNKWAVAKLPDTKSKPYVTRQTLAWEEFGTEP